MGIIRGGKTIESSEHRVYENAGAPTNGASGTAAGEAKKGALLVDTTNGALYINTNTQTSPTWSTIPSTSQQLGTISVYNGTGSTITANSLVYLSGFNAANDVPTITLADADAGSKGAEYVATADILDSATGLVSTSFETAASLNTNAATAGDFVYLSTTAGAYTLTTAPTGANAVAQPVGYVKVKSATVGVIAFWLQMFQKVGSNELQNASVLAAALGVTAGTITASRALVADANGNVAALKTTSLNVGASGSEVAVTATPAELNQVHGAPDASSTFTVGAEAAHVIITTVALKDGTAAAIAYRAGLKVWLSATAGGGDTGTDPTSNTTIGGTGAVALESGGNTHKTVFYVLTGTTGSFTVTTTQTAAVNYYLNIACPLTGKVLSSTVIAHLG